jgi:tetratricopeptide (TPR) repeat protein
MTADEETKGPLSGETLFILGRLQGVTRRRLDQLVQRAGGKLAAKASSKITLIALGHSAKDNVLPDGRIRLPTSLSGDAPLISELTLKRRLGLAGPPPEIGRTLTAPELERVAGLSRRLVACLALFDVLEPVDDQFSYRDLVAAREAGKLLARGVDIARILDAALSLGRRGTTLADARLVEARGGQLFREIEGKLAEFDGQLTMPIGDAARTVDELLGEAEAAEETGDLAAAERLYSTALRADPNDPVLAFNLGNIFDAQGRGAEAKIAWQIAVARDPAFADAWYNLGLAAEDDKQTDLAIALYRRAANAQPDYGSAHFNLAMVLTRLERCAEAITHWEKFLTLEQTSAQAVTARRAIALCRMHLQRERARAG